MKQTVTTTSLFKIILVFTLLFAAFLALAINYNKAFKMKNETLSIIEKYEGINNKSLEIINNYLDNNSYTIKKSCEDDEYGMADLSNNRLEKAVGNTKYYYCVSYYCDAVGCRINDAKTPNGNQIYYKMKLFFKFNLPVFGDLFTFDITGETKGITLYDESQKEIGDE